MTPPEKGPYSPPECDAGHGPMHLLRGGTYRRLHVVKHDGLGLTRGL